MMNTIFWRNFRIRLNYFLKNFNITGIRYLSDQTRLFGKIFWLIILSVSFWIMLKILIITSERYNSNIINIGIDSAYLNWNSTFPSISICLMKGRSSRKLISYIRRFNITYSGTEALYSRNLHSYMFTNPDQMNIDIRECENLNKTCGIDIDQLKNEFLPNSCNDILMNVQFSNKIYKNCDEIFKFHKTEMGYCFIANSLTDYGYEINNLPLQFNRAINDYSLKFLFKKSSFLSYSLYVHSPEDLPSFNLNTIPTDSVHLYYSIEEIINESDVIKEDIFYRGCRFPNEILDGSAYHYSFSTCMSDLRIKNELKYCNCTLNTAPEKFRDSYCTIDGIDCLSTSGVNSVIKNLHYESNEESCLPSCLEQTIKFLGEHEIIDDNLPDNVGKMIIEIIDLPKVRYVRKISLTRLDIVVNIGGIVGLFFGASIINIVEFIYIWFIRQF